MTAEAPAPDLVEEVEGRQGATAIATETVANGLDAGLAPERLRILRRFAAAMETHALVERYAQGSETLKRPPGDGDLVAHARGERVVGLMPMAPGGETTRTAVLDFDDHAGTAEWSLLADAARRVAELLRSEFLSPYPVRSRSGRGVHLWLLWADPLPAAHVRGFLRATVSAAGFEDADGDVVDGKVRVFPTHDRVRTNGTGNGLTLPFAGEHGCALDPRTLEPVALAPEPSVSSPRPVLDFHVEPRRKATSRPRPFRPDVVKSALDALDAGCSRAGWVRVGMGLKESAAAVGFDLDTAFELWREWSATAPEKYDARRCREEWSRFRTCGDGVTLGTVFHLAREAGWEPPGVVMVDGQLVRVVNRAEAALLAAGEAVYQRAGALVRPARLDEPATDDGVRRPEGALVLLPVTPGWLVEAFARSTRWYRPGKDGPVPADPAPRYARTLLDRAGTWRFSALRGVVAAPTLTRHGRVLQTPGFDEGSGLLLDFPPDAFPPVPEAPTQEDARAALALLERPLREFTFDAAEPEAAKSVALAALLTAVARPGMRTAPLHAFDAPVAGSGKSLLAECVGLLATGAAPPSLSQGKTDEEDEKRLATVLAAGDSVVLLDNVERPLAGDFLCSLLTQEVVQARILGRSERVVLPSTALVLATGNNLQFKGDVARRVVRCRVDPGVEKPDQRPFDFDPRDEVRAQRPALVAAALIALRAFHVAGRPGDLAPFGSFEDYALVRGTLAWLGYEDPAETRARVADDDPLRAELEGVVSAWAEAFGSDTVDLAALGLGEVKRGDGFYHGVGALRARLVEATGRGAWSSKSVGRWLARGRGRVVAGLRFEHAGKGSWRLRPPDEEPRPGTTFEEPEDCEPF